MEVPLFKDKNGTLSRYYTGSLHSDKRGERHFKGFLLQAEDPVRSLGGKWP
jgi:hypothetical protein